MMSRTDVVCEREGAHRLRLKVCQQAGTALRQLMDGLLSYVFPTGSLSHRTDIRAGSVGTRWPVNCPSHGAAPARYKETSIRVDRG